MRNLLKSLAFAFIVLLSTTACDRNDAPECPLGIVVPEQDYEWLKLTIEQLAIIDTNNEYFIEEYIYNNETVVLITDCKDCADPLTEIKNCKGETICTIGGVAGANTCPDFESNSEFIREIYP